jgi:hypothetical protein
MDSLQVDQSKVKKKKNLRLKTNNKSTEEAQPANYLKSQPDYTPDVNL